MDKKTLYRLTSIPKSEVNLPDDGAKKIINVFQNSAGFHSQKNSKPSISTVISPIYDSENDQSPTLSKINLEMKKVETALFPYEKENSI